MARPVIIILFFFYSKALFSEPGDSLKLLIPLSHIESFSVDTYGNIYVVKKNNEVSCYTGTGELKYSYRSPHRNHIRSMDASNPLKIILFYDGIPEVVFLDKYLTETGSLKFAELGFQEVSAICLSSDNKLWLYDIVDNSISKIDADVRKVLSRNRLTLQGLGPVSDIPDFKEYRNSLFLNNAGEELIEFDFLGNKSRKYPVAIPGNFNFSGDSLIFIRNDSVFFYSFVDYTINFISLPYNIHSNKIIAILFSNEKFYFLKNSGIYY